MPLRIPIVSKFDNTGVRDASNSLDKLGSFAKGVGGALAGAFTVASVGAVAFAASSMKAADESFRVGKALEQAAKNSGVFGSTDADIQKATTALSDHATKLAELTGIDDEVLLSMEKTWMSVPTLAGLGTDGIQHLAEVAADVAAGTGKDIESIGGAFVKVAGDGETAMSKLLRAGIVFTDEQKNTYQAMLDANDEVGAQTYLIDQLGTKYAGMAEAMASPFDRLKVIFENLQETVGTAMLPAVEALVPVLSTFVNALTSSPAFASFIDGLAMTFQTLTDVIVPLLDPIMDLVMTLLPPLLDIIAMLAPFVGKLVEAFIPFVQGLMPLLMDLLDQILPIFMDLVNLVVLPLIPLVLELVQAFAPLIEAVLPLIGSLIAALAPAFISLVQAVLPLVELIMPPLISLLNLLMPIFLLLIDLISGPLTLTFQALGGVFQLLSGDFTGAGETFKQVFEGMSSFGRKIVNDIIGVFEGGVNFVIDGINRMLDVINNISFDVPDWVPGFGGSTIQFDVGRIPNVSIPRLQDGAIIMPRPGGTMATIGEAGQAEAVIPLDRLNSMMGGSAGGGATYVVNVNGGLGTSADIGRAVVDAIKKFERVSGPVFAGA